MKKWKTAGYIALNKNKTLVIIKIGNPETGGDYYIAELPDVLEALTKQTGYAKIYKKGK